MLTIGRAARLSLLWLSIGSRIAFAAEAPPAPSVEIAVLPQQPLIERTLFGQDLNFDFRVVSRASIALKLNRIGLRVRDAKGAVLQVLEINDNGLAPGIDTI